MQVGKEKNAENSEGERNGPSFQKALVGIESCKKVIETRHYLNCLTLRDASLALHRSDHDLAGIHGVRSVPEERISIREDPIQNLRHLLQGEDGVFFHPAVFVDRRLGVDKLGTGVGKADIVLSCRKPILLVTAYRIVYYHRVAEKENTLSDIGNAVRFHPEIAHCC